MVIRKLKKYGGAERPCAVMDSKPISSRIVGRKTGKEENDTLHEKYINAVQMAFGSMNVKPTSLKLMRPTRSVVPVWRTPLATATRFSSSFKNLADCGLSGRKKYATGTMARVGRPSTRKRSFQLAIAACPEVIPYASAPAKHVARGAAVNLLVASRLK